MKVKMLITLFFLMSISISAYADYQTTLLPGVFIPNVDVGDFSASVVYDWNSDGKKDLIIGSRTGTAQPVIMDMLIFMRIPVQTVHHHSAVHHKFSLVPTVCSAIDAIAGG